jgi:hypothetical protein
MTQRRNLAWALGLAVMTGLAACGSRGPSPNEPTQAGPDAGSPGPGALPGAPAGAPGAGSTPAAAAACDFRVGEICFATDSEACAAAGCKPGGCIVLESYPAQITCK